MIERLDRLGPDEAREFLDRLQELGGRCASRRGYDTELDARKAGRGRVTPERCPICGRWHLPRKEGT